MSAHPATIVLDSRRTLLGALADERARHVTMIDHFRARLVSDPNAHRYVVAHERAVAVIDGWAGEVANG